MDKNKRGRNSKSPLNSGKKKKKTKSSQQWRKKLQGTQGRTNLNKNLICGKKTTKKMKMI